MPGPEPAARAPRLASVTSVTVVEQAAPDAAGLAAWGQELAELFTDVELAIVANGVASATALQLEALVTQVADLTVHFLAARIDHDAAHLVGLDAALGDWVVLAQPRPDLLPALRQMVARARDGYQVLSAVGAAERAQSWLYNAVERGYLRLFHLLTGRQMLRPTPVLRLYARPAALFIAGSAEGEMLLRAADVAGGFPAFTGHYPELAPDVRRRRTWRDAMAKAVQGLLSASTIPLRLASLIALASGGLSLLYSLYVVGIYLLKPDVLQGWTTLSLQISGMMFLFSLLFALMAEYVLGIYRGLAPRRRYVVTRELRSPKRRHADRLNVIDETGAFRLGMPEEIAR